MNNAKVLDWVQEHLSELRHTMRSEKEYDMVWIDDEGYSRVTRGASLRDCVHNALTKGGELLR